MASIRVSVRALVSPDTCGPQLQYGASVLTDTDAYTRLPHQAAATNRGTVLYFPVVHKGEGCGKAYDQSEDDVRACEPCDSRKQCNTSLHLAMQT